MLRCGLLGGRLGHSYSPAIHAMLGDYEYRLCEKTPEEVGRFLTGGDFDGLNVTIPYKKTVMPFCAELSETARRVGCVNTIVRRPDGTLFGDNTDVFGFSQMVFHSGVPVQGRKALVFGSGGASGTACDVLRRMGAEVVQISRSGKDNYENLERHADAQILVNTTPLGMYPNNGTAPVTLERFPDCALVLDVVYNPARTALLLEAERRGVPHAGGLEMLVAQAARSSELFTGRAVPDGRIAEITKKTALSMQNIVLIGMPGCGKSMVGRLLAERLGRELLDADAAVEDAAGCTIPEIFAQGGEAAFRRLETQALEALGKRSGCVIATGGGCVTRAENYPLLHQNSVIVWLQRDTARLPSKGRPLSQNADLAAMYAVRAPLYARFSDYSADNNGSPEETVRHIMEVLS